MEKRPAVPKFGNWGAGENLGYTVYFEDARKGRGGAKVQNPNDPQDNPSEAIHPRSTPATPNESRSGQANKMRTPPRESKFQDMGSGMGKERKTRTDHGDTRRFPRNDDNTNGRTNCSNTEPQNHGSSGAPNYGEVHRRTRKGNAGSENGYEKSAPQHQGKASGRGSVESPARERKGSQENSYGTPGRVRMRPNSPSNGNHDRGAAHALPKFGDWDVKNPAMAAGYTQIFNRAREEKNQRGVGVSPAISPGMSPGHMPHQTRYNEPRKKHIRTHEPNGGCCFTWGRK